MANSTLVASLGTMEISLWVAADPSSSVAQTALSQLTSQVSSGALSLQTYVPGQPVSTVPTTVAATVGSSGGVPVTQVATVTTAVFVPSIPATTVSVSGGGSVTVPGLAQITLGGAVSEVINTDTSGDTVAIVGTNPSSTVIAGGGSNTVFLNAGSVGNVLLTGGNSYIGNNSRQSTTNTTLTGGTSLGDGRAMIDAGLGTSNITVGNNGLVNVLQGGGSANILAQSGTVAVAVSQVPGGSTVPSVATVTGSTVSGSELIYIPDGGAAFINPNASNVIVLGRGGAETLAGGSGSATVFGGTGVFTGGSAGGNILQTSTVNGVTTLIGAGASDTLIAQAGGDVLHAGAGADVLAGMGGGTVGNTFISGTGTTTIFGGAGGNNTIELGAGSAVAYGQHGTVAASPSSDTYRLYQAGGSATIGDFVVGVDSFKLSLGYGAAPSVAAPSVASAVAVNAGKDLLVTLSDGTKLTFISDGSAATGKIFT